MSTTTPDQSTSPEAEQRVLRTVRGDVREIAAYEVHAQAGAITPRAAANLQRVLRALLADLPGAVAAASVHG